VFGPDRERDSNGRHRVCLGQTGRETVMGDYGKLHNEELHDLYSSPDVIRVVKSRQKL
jgi:hypothetical protein